MLGLSFSPFSKIALVLYPFPFERITVNLAPAAARFRYRMAEFYAAPRAGQYRGEKGLEFVREENGSEKQTRRLTPRACV